LDAVGYPLNKPVAQIFQLAQNPITAVVMKKITPRFFIAKNMKEVYENDDLITDATIDRYYAMTLREGSRQAFVDRANQMHFDNSAAIKNIEQPVLILWGENDKWVPTDIAYRFQQDLKNDTLVFIKQCGHIPMEEKPEESAAIARTFFLK
jgi:pimeloyl-ACP methyl ester carboxylesterase